MQTTQHCIGQKVANDMACCYRKWTLDIQNAAFWRMKGDGEQRPIIVGNIGRDSTLHAKTGIGLGLIKDHVNAVSTRRGSARVINVNIVIAYR